MKQKKAIKMGTLKEYLQQKHAIELIHKEQIVSKEIHVPKNKEMLINHVSTRHI